MVVVPLLLFAAHRFPGPTALLDAARQALASNNKGAVVSLFSNPDYADYLLRMSGRQGGFTHVKVAVIPAPPGWEQSGAYWAVFHSHQDIEQDHDPVFPIQNGHGLLGREIPLWGEGINPIFQSRADVHILPSASEADITADLFFKRTGPRKATILRLNDYYMLHSARVDGASEKLVIADDRAVPVVEPGETLRAGSLLIPWAPAPIASATFTYSGILRNVGEDKISANEAYVTAWWVPTTAQLPHQSSVRVVAPKEWTIRSEGSVSSTGWDSAATAGPREQVVSYRCEIPISFPKVAAGNYLLAASVQDRGRSFSAYDLGPKLDEGRGKQDVDTAARAVRFYENLLGSFPFSGYDVLDSDSYYGIESYNYTVLRKDITSWATSHEIGHTYFGGLVPCPYVRDTWNEGMTQYVDSVLFKKDSDHTLEGGIATVNLGVPLTQMFVPWEYNDASYMRGAYVMRMLENEIGFDGVRNGLRDLIKTRVGKDTAWPDLRASFERASGQQLEWFWNQWIAGATFPKLTVLGAKTSRAGDEWVTRVRVSQSGTRKPFRLRFQIKSTSGTDVEEQPEEMSSASQEFDVKTEFRPLRVAVDPFQYTLAKVGPPVEPVASTRS